MEDIKAYKPSSNSIGSGQVLHCPYDFHKSRLVVREMADLLALDLLDKGFVTDQIVLTVGYDMENLTNPEISRKYKGAVTTDHYGRRIPKHAHGSTNLQYPTSSSRLITESVLELYDRIVNEDLLIRRVNVTANRVVDEQSIKKEEHFQQLDLFSDYDEIERQREKEEGELEREKRMNQAVLSLKKKYGKNAVIKGMNLEEGATAIQRNGQIGGHKA